MCNADDFHMNRVVARGMHTHSAQWVPTISFLFIVVRYLYSQDIVQCAIYALCRRTSIFFFHYNSINSGSRRAHKPMYIYKIHNNIHCTWLLICGVCASVCRHICFPSAASHKGRMKAFLLSTHSAIGFDLLFLCWWFCYLRKKKMTTTTMMKKKKTVHMEKKRKSLELKTDNRKIYRMLEQSHKYTMWTHWNNTYNKNEIEREREKTDEIA